MYTYTVSGHNIQLKSPHDLSFLNSFDEVFAVHDDLISGNLCFGVKKNNEKLFLKYAGAQTKNYIGTTENAIQRLQNVIPLYEKLKHKSLVNLRYHFELQNGIMLLFDFIEGFPIGPLLEYKKTLKNIPIYYRYSMLDSIFDFIKLASGFDLICSGITDKSLLVNPLEYSLTLTSVNSFVPMPFDNAAARLSGSALYLPPEAYNKNTVLGEKVNTYIMGALAMTLLGNRSTNNIADWESSKELYNTVIKALNNNPNLRHKSPQAFLNEWREGVKNIPDNMIFYDIN
ncbi:MAG: hypothetical protein GX337_07195 [Christensenellaceae bacterium]|nr:hypothetical protein [Christensenellaceae bacterium]